MKVIIAGGVAAGMSAASKIKRMKPDAEVKVFEKRGFFSYGACGLPYYIGGGSGDYRTLIARSPEQIEAAGIKAFLHHRVETVDTRRNTVLVEDICAKTQFWEPYDALLIATGAEALMPPAPGIEIPGVHTLKSLEDGIFLREIAREQRIKNVVLIGGGAIGVEAAEAFRRLSKSVRLIEAGAQILPSFDSEIAAAARNELERSGVAVQLEERALSFEGRHWVEKVITDKGTYPADLVILSIGIRPATGFLAGSGIDLAPNGAVITDREMRSSRPGIYAAGDCALTYHRVLGKNVYIALGTVANKCGRIAGENICGAGHQFEGALGSAAIKIFTLEFARCGINEKEGAANNVEYKTVTVNAPDHAGYYPGAAGLTIKLLYGVPAGKILGVQLYGEKGAALRADIFAAAIHGGMKAQELGMTDLVYAPPFSTVWDAVQIACNAAK
ncbi:MAG: CoA-disulfide reductase [Treponema sp.]|jgi:NADPH-dependent 2,4-dienoyl-CoA reductase/sulfur reductase-like enzyme|nr:CoA-disulfide reductase [Treponema sp.]